MDVLNPEPEQILNIPVETGYSISKFGHQTAILLLTYASIGMIVTSCYRSIRNIQTDKINTQSSNLPFQNSHTDNYMNSQNIARFNSKYFVVNPEFIPSQKSSSIFNYDTINSKFE